MMSSHTCRSIPSFEACDQFFGIAELLEIFLNQCPPSVLFNCTMVCRNWNERIKQSTLLQEHLFFKSAEAREAVEPKLNPMLAYFAPILVPKPSLDDASTFAEPEYAKPEALTSVPWARNTSMTASTRRAFARPEASWRSMLVSQPPISRIDWWHRWTHDRSAAEDPGSWIARRVFDHDSGAAYGWGHQDQSREFVTLGMLWDLVESRMTRGCTARVQFFLNGMSAENDLDATEEEKQWIAENNWSRRPYTPTQPRITIRTQQVWSKVPWAHAGFDVKKKKWVSMPLKRRTKHYAGDGFNILRSECHYDYEGKRWSKSEGFRWVELDGESSGSGGGH
jgi:hypothetical protein